MGQIIYTDKAILAVEQNKVLMPPTYNKYAAWGFADHSLRVGNYDSDKAVFVCESAAQACGELLACVCVTASTLVTAGTSTVQYLHYILVMEPITAVQNYNDFICHIYC